jgi:hypothetical protein
MPHVFNSVLNNHLLGLFINTEVLVNGFNLILVGMNVLHDVLLSFLKDVVRSLSTLFY